MVTTITTATTNIATNVAGTSLAIVAIVTLIALLIQKEIVSGLTGTRAAWLSQTINITLLPLIIVFAATFVVSVLSVLH